MAAFDDLNAAVTALTSTETTDLAALNTSVTNLLGAIATAISGGVTPAQAASVVQSIGNAQTAIDAGFKSVQGELDAETAKLVPPPPPPTPPSS